MDDIGSRIKHITHELKEYIETRLELTILNFGDRMTYVIGKSVQQISGYAIFALGLVFAMTALAIYLGDLIGAEWAGYAIVASPFLLIGLYFILTKSPFIAQSIQEQILSDLLESFQEEKKDTPLKQLSNRDNIKKESK